MEVNALLLSRILSRELEKFVPRVLAPLPPRCRRRSSRSGSLTYYTHDLLIAAPNVEPSELILSEKEPERNAPLCLLTDFLGEPQLVGGTNFNTLLVQQLPTLR